MSDGSGNKAYGSLPKGGTLLLQRGEDKMLRVIKGRTYNVRIARVALGNIVNFVGVTLTAGVVFPVDVAANVVAFRVQNPSTTADIRVATGFQVASATVGWLVARRVATGPFYDTGWVPLTGMGGSRNISLFYTGVGTITANIELQYAGNPASGPEEVILPVDEACCPHVRVFFASGGSEATPSDFELQPGQDFEFTADNDTIHFIQFETNADQAMAVWVREAVGNNG